MCQNLVEKLTEPFIKQVDQLIIDQLQSPIDLVNQVCSYLILNGGKRFRPRLILIIAELLKKGTMAESSIQKFAACLEMIHTATLIHDDVIDNSSMRRNKPSTNQTFGNTIAVLAGDYIFTKAFTLCKNDKTNAIDELINCLAILVQGEIDQLSNIADINLCEEKYFNIIYAKTSVLFETACAIPAINLGFDEHIKTLKTFGRSLGNAFQIQDDILDYTADSETLGKNIGDDLQEEKITLPLIYAFQNLSDSKKELLKQAIKKHNITEVLTFVSDSNAIELCKQRAQKEINKAINALEKFPESDAKTALIELAKKTIERTK